MQPRSNSPRRMLVVLHPVFALTGVLHAIGGPLLPSIASTFHLNDNQSGLLFLMYFAGTSLGALFCRVNYARTMALGFLAALLCCLAVATVPWPVLPLVFLLLGISVGAPMSAVSLFAGRTFPDRCAPLLTFLNFSWSIGALVAPLLAARVLVHHGFRSAYLLLSLAAAAAALACALLLQEAHEAPRPAGEVRDLANLRLIAVFCLAAFLQVGVENTTATWLTTYALRMTGRGIVLAAASSSLYWIGFLASRGFASLLLLKADPTRIFRMAIAIALAAAVILVAAPSIAVRSAAMFVLGAALAPVYPLVIAGSLARGRQTSDTRWVLATAGFGGSVLPWAVGWISNHTGSLRIGMLTIPAALLLMALVLPSLSDASPVHAEKV